MNYSIYIFGKLSSGYTQYPEDSSSIVLKNIYSHCKAPTQIVIHRDENLMYYCYIRKLGNNRYLGFCIVINGYYLSKIDSLFSLFENTIEKIVTQGVIIHFSEDGTLTTSIDNLRSEEEEVESLTESLRIEFEGLRKISKLLPQTDYSIAKDSIKEHCISDGVQDIVRASYSYGFTYIYKDEDYDTVHMNSYKSVLSKLNQNNIYLNKKNKKLQEENAKILRQKKQFTNVSLLILIVIGCGIGLFVLNINLNYTQNQLDNANGTISKKNNLITEKDALISQHKNCIDSLYSLLSTERNLRNIAEDNLTQVCNNYPFIVTSLSISSDAVSFDYYTTEERTITITIKAINVMNSQIFSSTHTDTYYKEGGSKKFYFSRSLYTSDYYYVILMYNGKIIAGKRW